MQDYFIKDESLAEAGEARIRETEREMPVLGVVSARLEALQKMQGQRVAVCSHVTKETANLCIGLQNAGAEVMLCAANPFTVQDDVAAALVRNHGIRVYGSSTMTDTEWLNGRRQIAAFRPHILADDAAEALPLLTDEFPEAVDQMYGTLEQTTAGVMKLNVLKSEGLLRRPAIAVNSSNIKHLFDNHYGVGQGAVTGLLKCCGTLMAGKKIVVCGFGNVGSGTIKCLRGMGMYIIVCEVDPLKAMEAHLQGYSVMSIEEAAPIGDIFITATGSKDIIPGDVIRNLKYDAILGNIGSGRNEIDVNYIFSHSTACETINPYMKRYTLDNGNKVRLITNGSVLNIISAGGNTPEIMDFTFSAILLGIEWLFDNRDSLETTIHTLPADIDRTIALIKLNEFDIHISQKSPAQLAYEDSHRKC